MTFDGLGDMFEGDFAYMCAEKFLACRWGLSRRNEDPHRHEWNLYEKACIYHSAVLFKHSFQNILILP